MTIKTPIGYTTRDEIFVRDRNIATEILGQLESFKTQMCACKDVACADKVTEARREYRKTMREKLDKGSKPSAAQDRKGKALEVELQACRKALVPETGSAGSGNAVENAD